MLPRTRVLVTFVILVSIISSLYFFSDWFSKVTGFAFGEDEKIKLAQCLTERQVVLYVSGSCFACDKQTDLFGEKATEFLTIVECKDISDCPDLGGVPAWQINNEFYYDVTSLKKLQDVSGCEAS